MGIFERSTSVDARVSGQSVVGTDLAEVLRKVVGARLTHCVPDGPGALGRKCKVVDHLCHVITVRTFCPEHAVAERSAASQDTAPAPPREPVSWLGTLHPTIGSDSGLFAGHLALVGVQWVPPEWKSCMMIVPGCLVHSVTRGVFAVLPVWYPKSAQPMSSPNASQMHRRPQNHVHRSATSAGTDCTV